MDKMAAIEILVNEKDLPELLNKEMVEIAVRRTDAKFKVFIKGSMPGESSSSSPIKMRLANNAMKLDLPRAEDVRKIMSKLDLGKGEAMVCMEIDISDDEVVLSDEDTWLHVLNNWYLSDASCEEEYDKEEVWLDGLNEDEKQKAIVDSWQLIFDITPFNNDFKIKGRYVQATFWELRADQIRKVVFFNGR